MTGATGFIGSRIVRQLLTQGREVIALVRGGTQQELALRRCSGLGRLTVVAGDVMGPNLGLSGEDLAMVQSTISQIVHAAAVYRLDISWAEAMKTNVQGTANVLAIFGARNDIELHYISSITVAGRAAASTPELPVDAPADFRNHYERSKWHAEKIVGGNGVMPTRIYRPGIVIGDSSGGVTSKFDGPYAAFAMMWRHLPFLLPGDCAFTFPLVTVDLVADTVCAGLGERPNGLDVLHVIDKEAPTLRQFTREMVRRLAGHERIWTVPKSLFRAVARSDVLLPLFGIQRQTLSYMDGIGPFQTTRFTDACRRWNVQPARLERAFDAIALYYALADRK
ncbi:MAG: SDR family oxidoreductase [Rhizomicrobium sp.]